MAEPSTAVEPRLSRARAFVLLALLHAASVEVRETTDSRDPSRAVGPLIPHGGRRVMIVASGEAKKIPPRRSLRSPQRKRDDPAALGRAIGRW